MVRHRSRGLNALIPLTPCPCIDATGAIPTHAFESWTACRGHDNILRNGLTKARTDSFWSRVLGQDFQLAAPNSRETPKEATMT